MKKIFEYVVERPLMVNLLMLFLCVGGLASVFRVHREAFPNITYDTVLIRTSYPGAGPIEIEKLITIPLERELKEVSDIKEIRSSSIENMSVIVVDIEPDARDKAKVVNDVQRAVDRTDDLPSDLDDPPIVSELETKNQPVVEVSLSGNLSETELIRHARVIENNLLDLPDVAAVARNGWRDREIWVELAPEKTAEYWLSLAQVMVVLKNANVNVPGGTLKLEASERLLRTSGEFTDAASVENVVVQAGDSGNVVRIRDLASVRETFAEEDVIHRTNGTRAINLVVIKKARGDAIDLVAEVKNITDAYRHGAPPELKVDLVNDFSFYIKRRLSALTTNGIFGFALVVITLLLFMERRIAFFTAIGIPFALLVCFFVMDLAGLTLNMISMFGLITVLGMLVDDGLVVSENAYRYLEEGLPPKQAALRGILEVWKPVASSVLTTIVAFSPLMFMSGIIGKFVRFIPLMVIIALSASLLQAYLVLPAHLAGMKQVSHGNPHAKRWLESLTGFYVRCLKYLLQRRYKVLAVFGGVFVAGGFGFF